MNDTAKRILDDAQKLYDSRKAKGKKCNYYDYNYFKMQLIDAGCFGYEKDLADILHV